jgi:hypothetical protein
MLFKMQKIDFDYGFSRILQYVPKLIDGFQLLTHMKMSLRAIR